MPRKTARSLWADKITLNSEGKAILKETDWGSPKGVAGARVAYTGIVLGIDPSLRGTGLAVLEFHAGDRINLLASQTVKPGAKATMPQCLAAIFEAIRGVCEQFSVRHVACEQTIYVQNFQTAQILGAARGAALASAAIQQLEIYEYPPLRVKQAVVGYGRASKQQMVKQIEDLLLLKTALPLDEADAAAVALCHGYTWKGDKLDTVGIK